MALFTGAFFVAQVSLIIVAKPFYAIFCTSCVPHKPKTGFTACQIVDNLERLGTLWYAMKQIWRTKKIIKMASNIEIQKKCEWCGTIFTAHKITTAYCSHRCANLAYKDRVRKKRIQEFHLKHDAELKPNSEKEFLTPTEVAAFLGVGRTSVYRYIKNAKIKAVRFDGKTLVRRSDIDKMFDYITASNNGNLAHFCLVIWHTKIVISPYTADPTPHQTYPSLSWKFPIVLPTLSTLSQLQLPQK